MFIALLTTATAVTAIIFPSLGVSVVEALDLWSSSVEYDSDLESPEAQYVDYSGYTDFAPQFTGTGATISPFIDGDSVSPVPVSSSSDNLSFTSSQNEHIEDIEEMFITPASQTQISPLNVTAKTPQLQNVSTPKDLSYHLGNPSDPELKYGESEYQY